MERNYKKIFNDFEDAFLNLVSIFCPSQGYPTKDTWKTIEDLIPILTERASAQAFCGTNPREDMQFLYRIIKTCDEFNKILDPNTQNEDLIDISKITNYTVKDTETSMLQVIDIVKKNEIKIKENDIELEQAPETMKKTIIHKFKNLQTWLANKTNTINGEDLKII